MDHVRDDASLRIFLRDFVLSVIGPDRRRKWIGDETMCVCVYTFIMR